MKTARCVLIVLCMLRVYAFRVQVRAVHYVSIEFGLGDQIHCGQNSDSDFKTEVPRVLQVVEADEVE